MDRVVLKNIAKCLVIVLLAFVWFLAGREAGHYDYHPTRLATWVDARNDMIYIMLPDGNVYTYYNNN